MVWLTYFVFRIVLCLRNAMERTIELLLDVQWIPDVICAPLLRFLGACWSMINQTLFILHCRLESDPHSATTVWMPKVTFFPLTLFAFKGTGQLSFFRRLLEGSFF